MRDRDLLEASPSAGWRAVYHTMDVPVPDGSVMERAHGTQPNGSEIDPFRSNPQAKGWNGKPQDGKGRSNPSNPSNPSEAKGSNFDPPLCPSRARVGEADGLERLEQPGGRDE